MTRARHRQLLLAPCFNLCVMKKIDVYERFCMEMVDVYMGDILEAGIWESAAQALQQYDEEILRLLLGRSDYLVWLSKVVHRERAGERAIRDYIWDGVVKCLEHEVEELCKECGDVDYDAPEMKKEREKERLNEEYERAVPGSLEWRLLWRRMANLDTRREKLRKYPVECYSFRGSINWEGFLDRYFDGRHPKSYKEVYEAQRDLAGVLRGYAEEIRNGE